MKLYIYAIFAIAVLLISGFARAEMMVLPMVQIASYQTPVHIEQVSLQTSAKQLTVAGSLPNPCMQAPSASLTFEAKSPHVLTLHMSSPMFSDVCMDRLQPYSSQIDLPTLAQASQLRIEAKETYILRTEGDDFSVQILGADLIR